MQKSQKSTSELFKEIYFQAEAFSVEDEELIISTPCLLDFEELRYFENPKDEVIAILRFNDFCLKLTKNAIENGTFDDKGVFHVESLYMPYHERMDPNPLKIKLTFLRLTPFKPSDMEE